MKYFPPKCSKEWTDFERRELAAWITRITLMRIEKDDPNIPVLAKRPIYELIRSLDFLMTENAASLEKNRDAYEKPCDTDKNYSFVVVVS